ncbi:hypothetical protein [Rhizobium sp. SSA_523]|uniref:hypothetical protein n=1 Tax=Rhizobium sp. SSA_523 TaxID=2952477 RepID=UPI0020915945|nr:hypothetical protein [Rhizobium sp. SSA_523]MCO5731484.1 hypothetical protein [Rhizobium sp. SSA_523]WKC21997.1 hypothetical protein QTJ18_02275 [Rhizobium sp. SSA_523]
MTCRLWAGAALAGTVSLWATAGLSHPVKAQPAEPVQAAFDIIETTIVTKGDKAIFTTRVRGKAGSEKPAATGKFEGSDVYAYVWPTSLNSGDVGFDRDQGILALAVTFHPDFDDAAYGAKNRDVWHPHWVVLAKDDACGGGLKVIDIPQGARPKVPKTWPGVPLLIDSPDYATRFTGEAVDVEIPLALISGIAGAKFDGVTAGLKVNGNLHAPLLCVSNVFKVASGDLSLPGTVVPAK